MPLASQILLIAVVLTAGIYDIRFRRIPNWLVLTGLLLGIALNTFLFEWSGVKTSLFGLGLAFAVYFPLYLLRGMGAGDVKLMATIGAIVGPGPWFLIFLYSGILGGIIAVAILLGRKRLRHTFWNVGFLLRRVMQLKAPYANPELDVSSGKGIRLPHGAVIALGTIAFISATKMFPMA